jgi:hypothetical protein
MGMCLGDSGRRGIDKDAGLQVFPSVCFCFRFRNSTSEWFFYQSAKRKVYEISRHPDAKIAIAKNKCARLVLNQIGEVKGNHHYNV